MFKYLIRKVKQEEINEALSLVLEVFMEFEAPVYSPEGIEEFKNIIGNLDFRYKLKNGICPLYVALDNDKIIGVIGMRTNKTHINLLFVKKEYQRQGIATALFKYLLNDILSENKYLARITVNASPYGTPFYLHAGFVKTAVLQTTNGISYTPMKYVIREINNPKNIVNTDRLYLREMNQNDIDDLKEILMDEEVMYAYNGAFSLEECNSWLKNQLSRYETYGFGLWAVILKDSNEMIGQCGLTVQDFNGKNYLEVGYLFKKRYWKNGYATEASKACIDYAFEKLNADSVCSIIRDTNINSINVAKRNGLKEDGYMIKHYRNVDMPHIKYSINK